MATILKIIGLSIFLVALMIFGTGYYFLSDMCANTVISSNPSPNIKWKAVLFERNCGATTGFSSQISLLEKNEELQNEAGNIYIAHECSL